MGGCRTATHGSVAHRSPTVVDPADPAVETARVNTSSDPFQARSASCSFCRIVDGTLTAHLVHRVPGAVAFLDHRPVFPGHVLVVPDRHVPTLTELEPAEVGSFFAEVQRLARAIPVALDAHGTFVACNNVVSQSVPHLHVHVVPRRRRDGLRGFFWPRVRYPDEDAARDVASRIAQALQGFDL